METRNYAPPKGPFIYVTEVRSRTVQQDHNIDRGFRLLSVNGVEATEFTEDPRGVLAAITERLEAPYALRFRQNGPKFLYHAGCGYLCDAGHSLQPHYVGTASCQKGHVLQAVSLETLSETCGTELSCDACCEAIFGPARPTDHSYACLDCLRERQDPPAKAEPRKVDTGQSYQILCPTCTWKLYRKGSTESPYKHLGQVSCQACDRTDLGPDAPKDGPALSDARSFYHCEECWSTGAKSDLCYLCALRQLKCTSGHDLDPLLTSPFAENLHCAVCLANLDAEEEAYHCRDCWWLRGARLDRCVSCAGQNQIRYTLDNDARMQVVPGNSPAGELVAAIPDEGPKANDLVAAAEKGHVEIVRLLLLLKADTGRGHVEMVCLMLEDNPHTDFADTDVADNLGRTALVLASDAGHADIVRLLLEAGASTEVADTGERTALMRAFDGGEITWKKPYEPVAHTRIRGPDGDVQLDVLGLEDPMLRIYPMGTRLSLSSLFDHREATITNLHETGKYVLSLDGDRKPLVFEPDLTNHVPAGGWRYYPGQKLAVCVKGLWREFKVHSLGEYGSLHMLEETGPKDPSKRQRVEVNLNSYNHTPAWLSASEWWNELCRWEDHLVAGTLATDALTAQPAELLSFEWCLEPCLSLREPPTGSCTFGDGIFMHRSALGPSPGKLWAFLHRLTQNSLAREKGQFTAREVVLVLGPVASGKTRLLQRLAVEAVKAHDSEMVPFIVPASRLLLVISIATKTSTETAYMKRHSRAYSKESEQICLKRLADTDFLLIYIRVMFGADSRTTQFLRQALHSRRLLLLVDSLEHCPITLQNPLLNGLARLAVAGHRVVVTGSPSAEIFGTFSQPKEAEEKNTSSSEEDEEEDDNASADELHDPRETGARRPSDADKQRPSVVRGRNSSVVSMDFSALAETWINRAYNANKAEERAAAETKRRPCFRNLRAKMLRIWMLSGELLTGIAAEELEELRDVRGLKQRLKESHGLASRFRQRLLSDGESLAETARLDAPMDLCLVLLPFVEVSPSQADNLAAAAWRGSTAEVESMLQLPVDPDLTNKDGRTALMMASRGGHVDIVCLLLEAGASKDVKDIDWHTALMASSTTGHAEIVRLLLESSAEKDLADKEGCTALMRASGEGHVECLRLLLEAGADKDASDGSGRTALMRASRSGYVDMVHLLLEAGADKDLTDKLGNTALMMSSGAGRIEIVRLLLEAAANKDAANCNGHTAFMMASTAGHVEIVRLLLKAGTDKDAANTTGYTALMRASGTGHVEMVCLLLEAKANKDFSDNDGYTALMRACDNGHVEIVRLLLEDGANKDLAGNIGRTALMTASGAGHVEIVHLLLAASTNTDLADNIGRTALMRASRAGHAEIVRLLLGAGASKDVANNDGYTALMHASEEGHAPIVLLLLTACVHLNVADNGGRTALMTASGAGHVSIVRLLLQAGAKKDAADDTGYTALMRASGQGHVEIVRLLLEAGANKDLTDKYGYTALVRTSCAGHVESLRLLLEVGANKDLADNFGRTALIRASRSGHVDIVRTLLDARADKNLTDNDGHTALMRASDKGHDEIVCLLLEHGAATAAARP
ncbi:ANKRD50 [Symbiodinium sp. KB8]|nr:ANKRD50 [Symbiodinium sp. KB8]